MHARVSTFEGGTIEQIEGGVRLLREQVIPAAQGIEGFAGVISLVDRAGGKQLTITLWESEEAMRASEEAADRLRQGAADALQAKIASVERYEVVVSEIRAPALSG